MQYSKMAIQTIGKFASLLTFEKTVWQDCMMSFLKCSKVKDHVFCIIVLKPVNLELLMKSFFCVAYCLLIYHYLSSTQQQNKYKKIKSATIVMQSYIRGWKVYHWILAILRGLFVKNMQNAVVAKVMAVW